jgi:hypothetical protein
MSEPKVELLNDLSVEKELEAIASLCRIWKCEYTYTGRELYSRIDGIFTRDNVIKGIFDVKVKNQSLSWFEEYKSCMVNYSKIQMASDLSRLLKVKFFCVYQTSDKHLLVFQISNEDGQIVCPMNIRYNKPNPLQQKNNGKPMKQSAVAYLPLENNDYLTTYKSKGIGY